MPTTTVSASHKSMIEAVRAALTDLIDSDDVTLSIGLPDEVTITDATVKISADVDVAGIDDDDDANGAATEHDDAAPEPEGAAAEVDHGEVDHADDQAEDHGDQLDREVDVAADFVEGLLDAMDLTGELELRLNDAEQSAEVEVVNTDNGVLIGRRGSTLEAVQELMRCALQSQFDRRVRITVDVEGYRVRRLEKLLEKAEDAIDDVLDGEESVRLEPMDVFERKAVHELVATVDGVSSRSQGREPSRRVVIEASTA